MGHDGLRPVTRCGRPWRKLTVVRGCRDVRATEKIARCRAIDGVFLKSGWQRCRVFVASDSFADEGSTDIPNS